VFDQHAGNGRRGVLVTRPGEAGIQTARRIEAMGLQPVLAPVLEIAPVATQLPDPARLQAIVITSANAIAGLPAAYHALDLLAVGDATAARARAAGFASVRSAGKDADALAALVGRACDPAGAALLLAGGAGQGGELLDRLRAFGFTVLARTVYEARPATELPGAALTRLADRSLQAALFFSPASARAFVMILQRVLPPDMVTDIDALAISTPTAEAARPLPWRRIRIASQPNQEELLALLDA
jgi:uroporphyrinogen-III synthase